MVEVGYVFRRSAWGVGYATEVTTAMVGIARDQYAMTQLGAITVVGNDASGRVLTKCGFVYERDVEHPSGRCRFYRLRF